MKKVKIGTAGVDSGQLMVSDPCYVKDFISNEVDFDNKKNDNSYSYNGACHQTLNNETQGGELGNGLELFSLRALEMGVTLSMLISERLTVLVKEFLKLK